MQRIHSLIAALVAALALSACALLPDEDAASGAAGLGPFPSTFQGDLPCADCPGIRYHLNLYDNHTYFLRLTYLGEEASFDDAGRWSLSDGEILVLHGGQEAPTLFGIREGGDRLRLLDLEGRPAESPLNYELLRSERFQALEPGED